ncbi:MULTISPECIES: flagellar basal body rod protein FlgC [Methylobacterium]|jgi:flagellar basal-body rod protein FlgC|uniref:Flagellar basal-body rod protein FlgC n=1 Tax=Methylobacterium radiotolerans (strain ATCC 27329 / DSM 1819 / JCM 2831 / NBRC 15690 / NCIMB 10815 / 0-1) TaxID=426355 RepID=B1M7G1_METRJ|nr:MULTISPECIES: flagellar basal body rod protein FlgC [Methylobacterium]ACB23686.1 flagellar basal-body rod protein FlgC [Methylobacterium radiotolerans JCM 2831]KIU36152.1 flagellar basal body rod protein FlgC [Methylobacterium radiotolerans]KTS12318.1 flagellar basal body rod protein FlgC [Methylobacterium radiotolerans]KTS44221.1 flagellar basal body rod protein FlgC [Methylobacterium radiotolerans]KZC02598.1 Flagellar basal-body rod protein FlgC [Methylobacterium radiotolerans]
MIDPLAASSRIAGSGMEAQSERLRVIAENIANARSTGQTAGSDPYTRKTITFRTALDRASGTAAVAIRQIGEDKAPFRVEYDPGNPAADADGNVKLPNVNMLIEMADMREANRSYEANLQMIKQTRAMVASIIELLRP